MGGEASHAWSRLVNCVKTGDTVGKAQGTDSFTWLTPASTWIQEHPEAAAIFNQAMQDASRRAARAVVDAYDFSHVSSTVDVGGSHGTVLFGILEKYPNMSGKILDMAHCREGATRLIREKNLADRAQFKECDFF